MSKAKAEIYIGLMSGTSMDGVDAVLVDLSHTNKPHILAHHYEPIPADLKQTLLRLCLDQHIDVNELGGTDIHVAHIFASAVHNLLQVSDTPASNIIAIGSHGQTIRHHPHGKYPYSLQIGDPNTIAHQIGITTVADFRRKDLAAGGEGAPLVPAFHGATFSDNKKDRVILNIGGIGNITFLPSDFTEHVTGFDTGPGNTLMDSWIQRHKQQAYDHNGDWATTGTINNALLHQLLTHEYFHTVPPKSTGRELFNLQWLEKYLTQHNNISANDVQATLLELTAQSISLAIKQYANHAQEIFACGGGAHNAQLMSRLTELLSNRHLSTTEELGLHPDWVEAVAFAWLAQQTLQHKTSNLPAVTGAQKAAILGGIFYA